MQECTNSHSHDIGSELALSITHVFIIFALSFVSFLDFINSLSVGSELALPNYASCLVAESASELVYAPHCHWIIGSLFWNSATNLATQSNSYQIITVDSLLCQWGLVSLIQMAHHALVASGASAATVMTQAQMSTCQVTGKRAP